MKQVSTTGPAPGIILAEGRLDVFGGEVDALRPPNDRIQPPDRFDTYLRLTQSASDSL